MNKIIIDQYITNILQPEIDRLNISLAVMQETGYNSKAIRETKSKLTRLGITYDFLQEIIYGRDEIEDSALYDLMTQLGGFTNSANSNIGVIQSTRRINIPNISEPSYNTVRIYLDDMPLTSEAITATSTPRTLILVADNTIDKIEATLSMAGEPDLTKLDTNTITFDNLNLQYTNAIEITIKAYSRGNLVIDDTYEYSVIYSDCSLTTYWVGATPERFTISSTNLNESTNITIDPNQGSNSSGNILNYDWIQSSQNMHAFAYRGPTTHVVLTTTGDSHALIIVPKSLEIYDIGELVHYPTDGDLTDNISEPMIQGLHYDTFELNSAVKRYVCYYLRDLTSMTFPERAIQFKIRTV